MKTIQTTLRLNIEEREALIQACYARISELSNCEPSNETMKASIESERDALWRITYAIENAFATNKKP